jgi:anti-sigma B factor antagonist
MEALDRPAVTDLPPLPDIAGTLIREIVQVDDVTIVTLGCERLDLVSAPVIRNLLVDLVRSGHHKLVLDLANVTFIDSAGLGALVAVLRRLRTTRDRRAGVRPDPVRRPAIRGDMRLACLQPAVRSLLEIIRLDRVFPCFGTTEEAVRSHRPAERA